VSAVAAGPSADAVSQTLAPLVDHVLIPTSPLLAEYQQERFLGVFVDACRALDAGVVLLGGDTYSQELTPRLAHRLGGVAASDAVGLTLAGDALEVRRAVYGGKAEAVFRLRAKPAVVWIRARGFAPPAPLDRPAAQEMLTVDLPPAAPTRIVERSTEAAGEVRLEDAARIVSGGRGIGGAEPFSLLRQLAQELGAQLAATRAPCDAGWVPSALQVGQTGKKVAPELYLAIGLSGSSQHLLGISDAKVIAAINTDPEAPIFKHSQFGLVEDFRKAVPLLCEKLAAQRQ
jgi:electron transfer flavoprotein alpha subunit